MLCACEDDYEVSEFIVYSNGERCGVDQRLFSGFLCDGTEFVCERCTFESFESSDIRKGNEASVQALWVGHLLSFELPRME